VSFFEIYGGKLYDLLNDRRKLVARAGPQFTWYKSTNTDAAARADAKQVGYSVYFLHWCKSTDTDAAARADAKQVVNIVGLQETEVTNVSHLMEALNAGYNDSILYIYIYIRFLSLLVHKYK
jgi:hypothetical protein